MEIDQLTASKMVAEFTRGTDPIAIHAAINRNTARGGRLVIAECANAGTPDRTGPIPGRPKTMGSRSRL